jgi:hypothetical protein
MNNKKLYRSILKKIPKNILKNKEEEDFEAIHIYLVSLGIINGHVFFDTDLENEKSEYLGYNKMYEYINNNKKIFDKFDNIDNIVIIIYGSSMGIDHFYFVNKNYFLQNNIIEKVKLTKKFKNKNKEYENIYKVKEREYSNNFVNMESILYREFNIYMKDDLIKEKESKYYISFSIDNNSTFNLWYSIVTEKYIIKTLHRLNEINKVLKPINKFAKLIIEQK